LFGKITKHTESVVESYLMDQPNLLVTCNI